MPTPLQPGKSFQAVFTLSPEISVTLGVLTPDYDGDTFVSPVLDVNWSILYSDSEQGPLLSCPSHNEDDPPTPDHEFGGRRRIHLRMLLPSLKEVTVSSLKDVDDEKGFKAVMEQALPTKEIEDLVRKIGESLTSILAPYFIRTLIGEDQLSKVSISMLHAPKETIEAKLRTGFPPSGGDRAAS